MTQALSKRAFIVTINYKGTSGQLNGCINDGIHVKQILIDQYGYTPEHILLLSDDTENKPTHKNILEGFSWLLSRNPASDFLQTYTPLDATDKVDLFFQYSGHGSSVIDKNHDEIDGKDEALCPIDYKESGLIIDDVIREKLACKVPIHCNLFSIVDACHSGSIFDLLWEATSIKGKFLLSKQGKYSETNANVVMLSGCTDNQTSADAFINGIGQGALTHAFLETLKAHNYKLTYDTLLENVRKLLKRNNFKQVPCLSFGKSVLISSPFHL